jgi:hypothetical protein
MAIAAAILSAASGCSSASPASDASKDFSMASCAPLLKAGERLWSAVSAREPLRRTTGENIVQATQTSCDDVKIQGEPDEEPTTRTVTPRTTYGVSPRHALFCDEDGSEDQIWVHDQPGLTVLDLPADVQALIDER